MRFLVLCCLLLCACVDTKKSELDAWTFHNKLNGGMRTEREVPEVTLDADLLEANFRKIAYQFEVDPFGMGDVGTGDLKNPAMIRRWEKPILLSVMMDPKVSSTARRDTYAFMRKLRTLTGVEFKISNEYRRAQSQEGAPNLLVLLGGGEFFDTFIEALRARIDGFREESHEGAQSLLDFIEVWHDSYSPCAGSLYTEVSEDGETTNGKITAAIVAIRTDLTEPNTQSCIEEELAQTMGLPNDNAAVRPSMFNDDEEFALMTRHDELLLKILYDDRLKPGMTPEESMPIVRQIAAELLPDA